MEDYYSDEYDESIIETGIKLSRETPSQVLSHPKIQDLLAQVLQTHLELHKTVRQVIKSQMNMQKRFSQNLNKAVNSPEASQEENTNTVQAAEPTPKKLPDKLVGPSPIVPVQVGGIYTKALLDTGARMTLLYWDV